MAAHLQQIVGQQPVDPQLVDELAVLISEAAAVRVAIQNTDTIRAHRAGYGQAGVHIGGDRLRAGHFGEDRVALRVDFDDLRFAPRQNLCQPAGAVAPHTVHDDLQARVADRRHVDQAGQMGQIGGLGLEVAHRAVGQGRVQRRAADRVGVGDAGFDGRQSIRRHRAAAGVPHLKAIVLRRVVAGGDIDCADGVVIDGREADHRRRRGPIGQQHA